MTRMARQQRHAAAIDRLRRRASDAVSEIWHDVPARGIALAFAACLWLAVALTEPAFLPLAAAAGVVLRFRLRHRPVERFDDWL
jgi:hypothetical protein